MNAIAIVSTGHPAAPSEIQITMSITNAASKM